MNNLYADTSPMSVRDWMITLLILAIPGLNLVMYLVWGLGNSGNVNRRNFCRASVYWFMIMLGVWGVAMLVAFVAATLLQI